MSQNTQTSTPQKQPGKQYKMTPEPISVHPFYKPAGKLKDKVVLVTGGDSGIGRAVAYHCALEGARVAFVYLNEKKDAEETVDTLQKHGGHGLAISADISSFKRCKDVIEQVIEHYGRIDCLINNSAEQHSKTEVEDIDVEQLKQTFGTNFFGLVYLTQLALPHMSSGSTIINSTSVTAYRGSGHLMDYAASKGAIVSWTRSIAKALVKKGIRVNAVAPGPVWTPLIPASFSEAKIEHFGENIPLEEAAQPADIAPCYVFLASSDSRYFVGQVLHPNGGEIVNA